MATSLVVKRQESIELEPRTLTPEEINCAREAALYVLSTTTPEEAVSIFTKGLKPVMNIETGNDHKLDHYEEDTFDHHCMMIYHVHSLQTRDVATAPF